jgi:hypothetical protein
VASSSILLMIINQTLNQKEKLTGKVAEKSMDMTRKGYKRLDNTSFKITKPETVVYLP